MASPTVRRLVTTRILRALAVQVLLLAAIASAYVGFHREIWSRVFGPYRVTVDEIAAINNLASEPRRFFILDEGNLIPLRIQDVTVHTRNGRETGRSYKYYFALRGKRTVLVRSSEEKLALPLTGALRTLPANLERRVWSFHPDLTIGAGVAPLLLEVEDPILSTNGFLTAVILIAPLIVLYYLLRNLARLMDFRRSPAVASLARLQKPLDEVVDAIDAELAKENSSTPMRRVLLSPSWLVHKRLFKVEFLPLSELLWVYAGVKRSYIYWFIPVGKTNYLMLGDRSGRLLAIQGRQKAVADMIMGIAQRVPWVLAGHSPELEQAFRSNREAMARAVDQRRQQVAASQPSASP
jgi:hypothetical protein